MTRDQLFTLLFPERLDPALREVLYSALEVTQFTEQHLLCASYLTCGPSSNTWKNMVKNTCGLIGLTGGYFKPEEKIGRVVPIEVSVPWAMSQFQQQYIIPDMVYTNLGIKIPPPAAFTKENADEWCMQLLETLGSFDYENNMAQAQFYRLLNRGAKMLDKYMHTPWLMVHRNNMDLKSGTILNENLHRYRDTIALTAFWEYWQMVQESWLPITTERLEAAARRMKRPLTMPVSNIARFKEKMLTEG